jgi:phosphoglucosamine mutase
MSGTPRLFGTDGIRAPFGEPPLDRATVTALAAALGRTLREAAGGGAPEVVVGGDTRASTPEICRWVAAGLEAGGARWRYVGVVPTPAVAWITRDLGAAAGVAVSASHNPLPDNGVKLIDARGAKWDPAAEAALERRMEKDGGGGGEPEAVALSTDDSEVARYVAHLAEGVGGGGRPLAGLKIALDAANGAASPFAERLFRNLGAEVVALCTEPDGGNINDGCGSTHPERLAATVLEHGCDLGFAFDGDADRCLLVDAAGEVRDGDAILYLWARALAEAGELDPPALCATSMSNLGLERALAAHGIRVVRCGVGDREVVETLRREGLVLGGEQSGHIVNRRLSSTGDGMLTAVQVAARVAAAGRPVAELLAGFRRFPQVLRNVRVRSKPDLASLPAVAAATRKVETELGDSGRLVLRYSGTEPLARVMIEGPDQESIDGLAGELAAAIEEEVGAR